MAAVLLESTVSVSLFSVKEIREDISGGVCMPFSSLPVASSGALPLGISGAVFSSEFSETSPSASVMLVPSISVTFPVTVVNSSVETVVVSAASPAETCAVPHAARDNAVAVEHKIQSDFFISFLLSKVCCFSVVKCIVAPHPKAYLKTGKTGKNLQILISPVFLPIL